MRGGVRLRRLASGAEVLIAPTACFGTECFGGVDGRADAAAATVDSELLRCASRLRSEKKRVRTRRAQTVRHEAAKQRGSRAAGQRGSEAVRQRGCEAARQGDTLSAQWL
eukprot:3531320-Pleurochrysis_carterae.AAC.1